jgi:hypothetical protein
VAARGGHQHVARLHVLQRVNQGPVVTRPGIDRQGDAAEGVLLCDGGPQAVVQRATATHRVHDESCGCVPERLHQIEGRAREGLALDQGQDIDHEEPLVAKRPGQNQFIGVFRHRLDRFTPAAEGRCLLPAHDVTTGKDAGDGRAGLRH